MHGVMNSLPEKISSKTIEDFILKSKILFKNFPPHSIVHLAEGPPLSSSVSFLRFPFSYISVEQKQLLLQNNQIPLDNAFPISTQVAVAGAVAMLGVGAVLLFKYKPWQAL